MILEYPITLADYSEILCIAIIAYKLSAWLRKDTHTPLLAYAYCYGAALLCAYLFELPVILALAPFITPIFFIMGIILHQESLQKNIITHKHSTQTIPPDANWLEYLLSSALMHINEQKSITFVLEHTDNISPFLIAPCMLNVKIHKSLLDIMLNPHIYETNHMVWIQSSGTLMSSQAMWKNPSNISFDDNINKEFSLLYTHKTDALVCILDQQSRTCTLIIKGNTMPHLTTYNAIQLIRKHIQCAAETVITKKVPHETNLQMHNR